MVFGVKAAQKKKFKKYSTRKKYIYIEGRSVFLTGRVS